MVVDATAATAKASSRFMRRGRASGYASHIASLAPSWCGRRRPAREPDRVIERLRSRQVDGAGQAVSAPDGGSRTFFARAPPP